ncbi:hypothetical protein BZA05DRAFT_396094 [Tricharina praecox]|uniref:uncharacterized protein n=1 Tax=Tricharina praecox TaxID=43433 RepID=UPI002220AF60|nr:uncharacterized protein BZA05DRAFT_396094 [Tricharina praecox]KAI5853447.1 hypothetical protein BZA05DRAFT_396094 [Tricharina praecox]
MPYDNHNQHYECVGSGINHEGTRYHTRDYGPNVRNRYCYNYSSTDGSYYYTNPDGSTYYKDNQGNITYTPPAPDNASVTAEVQRVSAEVEKSLLDTVEMLRDDDSMISRRKLIEVLTDAADSLARLNLAPGQTKNAATPAVARPLSASKPPFADGPEFKISKKDEEVESLARLSVNDTKAVAGERSTAPRTSDPWMQRSPRAKTRV